MLDEVPKKALGAALLDAADAWRARVREELARLGDAGLVGAAVDLLAQIDPAGLTQTALTARSGLSKQAVQQLLDRLETAGLVRRNVDQTDKRIKHVTPTEPGLKLLAQRVALEQSLEAAAREKLGKKRFTQLRKALRKLGEPG